jgi:beta-N-acetylhexosaminidase
VAAGVLVAASLLGLVAVPASATQGAHGGHPCAPPPVGSLSVRQLANQLVVVPILAGNVGTLGPAVHAGFGGILLFGATAPPTLGTAISRLRAQAPAGLPPLVMTDEEGGGVQRIANLVGPFPWARTMGATMTATQIRALAAHVASRLLAAGVTMDLAPVLDVDGRNVYPGAADADGYRSFGGSVPLVITAGTAFQQGLLAGGVLPVVKHFPGLGGSSGNTDYGPAATLTWAQLKAGPLHTFEAAINRGTPAIMVANAHVPGLTPLPATLSPAVLTDVLRHWLHFSGLVMTDSLTAGAIAATHLSVPAAAVASVKAGADMVLLGLAPTPTADVRLAQSVSNAIVGAVNVHQLPFATLQAAAAKVLAAKARLHC